MNRKLTVEVVVFKLKADASEEAFLQASHLLTPDLQRMSGYVRRELLKAEDGRWIDVVHWHSLAEARQAAEQFPTWESAKPFAQMIDFDTVDMVHLEQVLVA